MSQKLLELTQAENEWIEARRHDALSAIKTFAPQQSQQISLAGLDSAFSAWLSQHNPEQEDPNPFINAFGIGFGQYLAE